MFSRFSYASPRFNCVFITSRHHCGRPYVRRRDEVPRGAPDQTMPTARFIFSVMLCFGLK